jgi:hypothetical protein
MEDGFVVFSTTVVLGLVIGIGALFYYDWKWAREEERKILLEMTPQEKKQFRAAKYLASRYTPTTIYHHSR